MSLTEIITSIAGLVFSLLWYLLRQKDQKQQAEIGEIKKQHKEDFEKAEKQHKDALEFIWKAHHDIEKESRAQHNVNAKDIGELRLRVAEEHYKKPELDAKLEKIEASIEKGFSGIKAEQDKTNEGLDRLNAILLGRSTINFGDKQP